MQNKRIHGWQQISHQKQCKQEDTSQHLSRAEKKNQLRILYLIEITLKKKLK